ncbi:MAG: O-antigen ligase family protein [Candidatus Magasanikbacteria bacterium]|jgi:O-antigen ligase
MFKRNNQDNPPNLLFPRLSPWEQEFTMGAAAILLFWSLLLLLPLQMFLSFGVAILAIFLVIAFIFKLELLFYILTTVSFFTGWEISFSKYEWARNVVYLSSVNAPLGDFIGVMLLGLSLLAIIFGRLHPVWKDKKILIKLSGLYLLFLLWSLVCALFAYDHNWSASMKYLARNMTFVYVVFVVMPVILIDKLETVKNILKIWFGVGLLAALFGLSSLYFFAQTGWPRVTPYGIAGFAPLGYNHNLIAEVLVVVLPAGLYLFLKAKTDKLKQRYFWGMILTLLAALLTLSRAAWVTIFAQLAVLGVVYFEEIKLRFKKISNFNFLISLLVAAVFAYMVFFLTTPIVQSSTSSRFAMTEISFFYANRSPVFGYGPGMFVQLLSSVQDWTQEYGSALDSHGIVQKIIVEDGYVGLILILIFLTYLFKTLWTAYKVSDDKELYMILFMSVVGAVIFQFFNTSYFTSVMWLPIGLALSAATFLKKDL